jgi:hypothetical protein
VSPRDAARLTAIGRVGIGAALMLVPQLATPLYVRRGDFGAGDRMFARMVGARDLGLGLGVLGALGRGPALRGWLAAGILADAADIAASVKEGEALAPTAVPLFIGTAGVGVVMGAYALAGAGPKN